MVRSMPKKAFYRGKNKSYTHGHFGMTKRLSKMGRAYNQIGNRDKMFKTLMTRAKTRAMRQKWNNPTKGLKRKRYFPRSFK